MSRRLAAIAAHALLAVLAAWAAFPAPVQAAQPLAVLGGALLDGSGGEPIRPAAVVARDGVVVYAGPMENAPIPSDARVIDARSMTIVPGFIDAHAHVTTCANLSPDQARRKALLAGVTCLGDVGSCLERMADLARDPGGEASDPVLARVVFSGPVMAAPGGYPAPMHGEDFCLFVSTPQEAEAGVALLHRNGARLLKLAFDAGRNGQWPLMDPATTRAAVDAAHARNMVVRAHVEDLAGLAPALDAGADVIEHLPHRASTRYPAGPFTRPVPRPLPAYEDLLLRMAQGRIMAAPTLSVVSLSRWNMDGPLAAVALFHGVGGRVALATDAAFDGLEPGMVRREVELLLAAGFTPQEVIVAATRHAALACGRNDLGLLVPSMAADLLVLPGDFLADQDPGAALLHALDHVQWVVKAGRVVKAP